MLTIYTLYLIYPTKFCRHPSRSGNLNSKPLSVRTLGSMIDLLNIKLDLSFPNMKSNAIFGVLKTAGLFMTFASVVLNVFQSSLTLPGATRLTGPFTDGVLMTCSIARTVSSISIQGHGCVPSPNWPPAPKIVINKTT